MTTLFNIQFHPDVPVSQMFDLMDSLNKFVRDRRGILSEDIYVQFDEDNSLAVDFLEDKDMASEVGSENVVAARAKYKKEIEDILESAAAVASYV